MSKTLTKFEELYFQVTELWKQFCEQHADLFDMTCIEYQLLLENDLDSLEKVVETKNGIIQNISDLDSLRSQIIGKVNLALANDTTKTHKMVSNVRELLSVMSDTRFEVENKHLYGFNELLIEIIEKLQEQNKKNQIFINKAVESITEIKNSALGEKKYATYTSRGKTTTSIRSKN